MENGDNNNKGLEKKFGCLKIKGNTFGIYKGVNVIGRNIKARVPLKNINVSHIQAIIIIVDHQTQFISDFGSINGTSIDNNILTPHQLYPLSDKSNIKFATCIEAIYHKVPLIRNTHLLDQPSFDSQHTTIDENDTGLWRTDTQLVETTIGSRVDPFVIPEDDYDFSSINTPSTELIGEKPNAAEKTLTIDSAIITKPAPNNLLRVAEADAVKPNLSIHEAPTQQVSADKPNLSIHEEPTQHFQHKKLQQVNADKPNLPIHEEPTQHFEHKNESTNGTEKELSLITKSAQGNPLKVVEVDAAEESLSVHEEPTQCFVHEDDPIEFIGENIPNRTPELSASLTIPSAHEKCPQEVDILFDSSSSSSIDFIGDDNEDADLLSLGLGDVDTLDETNNGNSQYKKIDDSNSTDVDTSPEGNKPSTSLSSKNRKTDSSDEETTQKIDKTDDSGSDTEVEDLESTKIEGNKSKNVYQNKMLSYINHSKEFQNRKINKKRTILDDTDDEDSELETENVDDKNKYDSETRNEIVEDSDTDVDDSVIEWKRYENNSVLNDSDSIIPATQEVNFVDSVIQASSEEVDFSLNVSQFIHEEKKDSDTILEQSKGLKPEKRKSNESAKKVTAEKIFSDDMEEDIFNVSTQVLINNKSICELNKHEKTIVYVQTQKENLDHNEDRIFDGETQRNAPSLEVIIEESTKEEGTKEERIIKESTKKDISSEPIKKTVSNKENEIFNSVTQKNTSSSSMVLSESCMFDLPTQKIGLEEEIEHSEDIYFEPTQKIVIKGATEHSEDIFLEPTQKIGLEEEIEHSEDIFLQPTQKIVMKGATKHSEDFFLVPTQKIYSSKQASRKEDDDGIFDLATQKVNFEVPKQINISKMKGGSKKDISGKFPEDDYLVPTQKMDLTSTKTSNTSVAVDVESESDIFEGATQKINNPENIESSNSSDDSDEDDFFIAPTQKTHLTTIKTSNTSVAVDVESESDIFEGATQKINNQDLVLIAPTQKIPNTDVPSCSYYNKGVTNNSIGARKSGEPDESSNVSESQVAGTIENQSTDDDELFIAATQKISRDDFVKTTNASLLAKLITESDIAKELDDAFAKFKRLTEGTELETVNPKEEIKETCKKDQTFVKSTKNLNVEDNSVSKTLRSSSRLKPNESSNIVDDNSTKKIKSSKKQTETPKSNNSFVDKHKEHVKSSKITRFAKQETDALENESIVHSLDLVDQPKSFSRSSSRLKAKEIHDKPAEEVKPKRNIRSAKKEIKETNENISAITVENLEVLNLPKPVKKSLSLKVKKPATRASKIRNLAINKQPKDDSGSDSEPSPEFSQINSFDSTNSERDSNSSKAEPVVKKSSSYEISTSADPGVESQLEVLFDTQDNFANYENNRPQNPLAETLQCSTQEVLTSLQMDEFKESETTSKNIKTKKLLDAHEDNSDDFCKKSQNDETTESSSKKPSRRLARKESQDDGDTLSSVRKTTRKKSTSHKNDADLGVIKPCRVVLVRKRGMGGKSQENPKNARKLSNEAENNNMTLSKTKKIKEENAVRRTTRKRSLDDSDFQETSVDKKIRIMDEPELQLKQKVKTESASTSTRKSGRPSKAKKEIEDQKQTKIKVTAPRRQVKVEVTAATKNTSTLEESKRKRKGKRETDECTPSSSTSSSTLGSLNTSQSNSDLSTSTRPERTKRNIKHKVVFTLLRDPNLEKTVINLGGSMCTSIATCTVLVTKEVLRTTKLLSAIGEGKPICSPEWIELSKAENKFLDPWEHLIKDPVAEKKWDFSLETSLNRSRNSNRLFKGYSFLLLINPGISLDTVTGAVLSCGGKIVTNARRAGSLIVVSEPELRKKHAKFLKQEDVKVVSAEAIFDGVLKQEIIFDKHLLS